MAGHKCGKSCRSIIHADRLTGTDGGQGIMQAEYYVLISVTPAWYSGNVNPLRTFDNGMHGQVSFHQIIIGMRYKSGSMAQYIFQSK